MCTPYRSPAPIPVPRLLSRRGFLRAGAGTALAAGAMGGLGRPAAAQTTTPGCVPEPDIGIQLYTMREVMADDLDGTFAALAGLGYRMVEHAGFGATENGTAEEFRAALDRHGLRCTSGHQSIPYPFDEAAWEQTIEDALTVGQTAIVEPLPNFALAVLVGGFITEGAGLPIAANPVPAAVWADYAHTMNQAAEIAAPAGLRVGYHNHNPEFAALADDPDRTGYDVLLAESDPDLVHFELDLYWAWAGEQDPVQLLEEHPSRFRQFHVKDMAEDGSITAPGTGIIDFDRIFVTAEQQRTPIDEFTIEQDNAGQDAVESARLGYELLEETCPPTASGTADPGGTPDEPTTTDQAGLPATGGGLAVAGLAALAAAVRLRSRSARR